MQALSEARALKLYPGTLNYPETLNPSPFGFGVAGTDAVRGVDVDLARAHVLRHDVHSPCRFYSE